MVTYSDMIQFCIFIVALVGLCYEIFKGKRRQPPLPQIVTAIVQQLNIITKVAACGFPLCILNIAYPVVGRKSIKKITDVPNEKFSNEKICKKRKKCLHFQKGYYIITLVVERCDRKIRDARLAQLVEHLTLNQGVQGSNP